MRISDFFPSGGSANNFNLMAGATLAQNDTVLMGPDGLGYPVVCTDYAAVANAGNLTAAAQGQIVAETTVIAAAYSAGSRGRLPTPVIGSDGSVFRLSHSTGTGTAPRDAAVYKYAPGGSLIGKVPLSAAGIDIFLEGRLVLLSNGNIAAIYHSTGGSDHLYIAVIDQNLQIVLAQTNIDDVRTSSVFDAIALTGGGFMVCYQQLANNTLQKLAIYGNTGTPVLAPTTIQTWSGTAGDVYVAMVELSNLNIAISFNSLYTTTQGLYHGIWGPAGANVLPLANLDGTSVASTVPEISALTGFYCVAQGNGTNQKAWVFNTAGALQGAPFSSATTATGFQLTKLVNDGTKFYLLWPQGSTTTQQYTQLPTTGTGYKSADVTTAIPYTPGAGSIDAFCERGFIVGAFCSTTNISTRLGVISTAGAVVKTSTVWGSTSGTLGRPTIRIVPGGDYSFISDYEHTTQEAMMFFVGKYANSSVLGSNATSVPAGSITSISQNAGSYPASKMLGTTPKLFDHSATNQYGNRGVMLTNGLVLKGM